METKIKELGFLYFKPNDDVRLDKIIIDETRQLLGSLGLEVLYEKEVLMTEEKLREHHPDLFIIEPGYTEEEEKWKKPTIERALAFNKNLSFLFFGEDSFSKIKIVKDTIRGKYVSKECWEEGVSKPNCIHTSRNLEELRRDIKALIPEKIELLKRIEHINQSKTTSLSLSHE